MFLYRIIRNTKQRNLTDDKIMRSSYGLYLSAITPFFIMYVYPPPQRISYTNGKDLIFHTLNLILLTSSELHCLCTILAQISSWEFVEEEETFSEHRTSFKGDGDGDGDSI